MYLLSLFFQVSYHYFRFGEFVPNVPVFLGLLVAIFGTKKKKVKKKDGSFGTCYDLYFHHVLLLF